MSEEKAEFCWNSRRWIEFMAFEGAPETCPDQREQLTSCERCGYYEQRKPTKYLIRKRKALKEAFATFAHCTLWE